MPLSRLQLIDDRNLDRLRKIGDPVLDRAVADAAVQAAADAGGGPKEPDAVIAVAHRLFTVPPPDLERVSLTIRHVTPDSEKLLEAQQLFATHGNEIAGALLLAALPQSYAARWGAGALVASSGLHRDFRQRIIGTAQFLVLVTRRAADPDQALDFWTVPSEDAQPPDNGSSLQLPWQACRVLRSFHARIRAQLQGEGRVAGSRAALLLGHHNSPPLNQEDLLAMLLTFSVSVFEVMERFDITWTADQQEAYLHLWDVIGAHLGIGDPTVVAELGESLRRRLEREHWVGLRPPTIEGTRQLLTQLRRRLWTGDDGIRPRAGAEPAPTQPPEPEHHDTWEGARSSQILIHALLTEMMAAMPARRRSLPLIAVRKLAPPVVRQQLLLGGGGLPSSLADPPPGPPGVATDRRSFAVPGYVNRLDARLVRTISNEVTRHVLVHFLRSGRLHIPDLEDWSESLVENGGSDLTRRSLRPLQATHA